MKDLPIVYSPEANVKIVLYPVIPKLKTQSKKGQHLRKSFGFLKYTWRFHGFVQSVRLRTLMHRPKVTL